MYFYILLKCWWDSVLPLVRIQTLPDWNLRKTWISETFCGGFCLSFSFGSSLPPLLTSSFTCWVTPVITDDLALSDELLLVSPDSASCILHSSSLVLIYTLRRSSLLFCPSLDLLISTPASSLPFAASFTFTELVNCLFSSVFLSSFSCNLFHPSVFV